MTSESCDNNITISLAKLREILDRAIKAASLNDHKAAMVRCSVEMSLLNHEMSEVKADYSNATKRLKETEE